MKPIVPDWDNLSLEDICKPLSAKVQPLTAKYASNGQLIEGERLTHLQRKAITSKNRSRHGPQPKKRK